MNLYDRPEKRLPKELAEELLRHKNVRIERIVSDGHVTDWYDQAEAEWVCLLSGEADLQFERYTKTLRTGESIFIPRHVRHRVVRTTRCIWLCVFIAE